MPSLASVLHRLATHYFSSDSSIVKWSFSKESDVLLFKIYATETLYQLRFFTTEQKYWKASANFKMTIEKGSPTFFERPPMSQLISNFQKLDRGQIRFVPPAPKETPPSTGPDIEYKEQRPTQNHMQKK